MKLKEGLVKFLDEMCNGKSIDRNIMKRICIPASNIGTFELNFEIWLTEGKV